MAKFDIKTVKPKFVVTTSPENKIDVVVNKPIIETKLSKSFLSSKIPAAHAASAALRASLGSAASRAYRASQGLRASRAYRAEMGRTASPPLSRSHQPAHFRPAARLLCLTSVRLLLRV